MDTPQRALLTRRIGALLTAVLCVGVATQRLDGQEVFYACYVPQTGIMYLVEADGTCKTDNHIAVSWTSGVVDHLHSNLEGLDVGDDHPQYLLRSEAPDGHSLDAVDGSPIDIVTVDEDGNVHFGPNINSLHHSIDFYVKQDDLGEIYLGKVEAFHNYGYIVEAGGGVIVGEYGIETEGGIRITEHGEGIKFPDGTVQYTAAENAPPSWSIPKALGSVWVATAASPACILQDTRDGIRTVSAVDGYDKYVWCEVLFKDGVVSSFPFLTGEGELEQLRIEKNYGDRLIFMIKLNDEQIPAIVHLMVF